MPPAHSCNCITRILRCAVRLDAIALPSTRLSALHKEPVVAFCHHGVQVDISGLQYDLVEAAIQLHILLDYPRLSLKSRLTDFLCTVIFRKPTTTYDSFLRDFGERHVPGHETRLSVDRLEAAPLIADWGPESLTTRQALCHEPL
jgi:hypothetical protein